MRPASPMILSCVAALSCLLSPRTATPAPALDPVILRPRAVLPGYAVARARLSGGEVVQVNDGCGEWRTYTEGLLLSPAGEVLARFGAGPFFEIPGFLIVEQHVQVGSDGGGAPLTLPPGAEATISSSFGAIWVTRVVAIELATGEQREAPGWDSFAPVAIPGPDGQPSGRVLFARGRERFDHTRSTARRAESLHLWDVAAGETKKLAELDGPVEIVPVEGRAHVSLGEGALEVSHGGKVRTLARMPEQPPAIDEPVGPSAHIGDPPPAGWVDPAGRAIVVEEHGRTRPPTVGLCGVDRILAVGDAILVDGGLYEWPASSRRP